MCVHRDGCWVYDLPELSDKSVVGTLAGEFSSPLTFYLGVVTVHIWHLDLQSAFVLQMSPWMHAYFMIASSKVERLAGLQRVEWLTKCWGSSEAVVWSCVPLTLLSSYVSYICSLPPFPFSVFHLSCFPGITHT